MPERLEIQELRQKWALLWGISPPKLIGRAMLEKSLYYKEKQQLSATQEIELNKLIKKYKRNPKCFDQNYILKPGTKLIRNWQSKKHIVIVKIDGFEYQGNIYSSLSRIANEITGSKWNGYLFFGLKKSP